MEMNIFWRRFAVVFFCLSGNVCVYAGWFDELLSPMKTEKENASKDCNSIFNFEDCEKDTTTNKVTTKKAAEATFLQNITRNHARFEANIDPNSTPSLFVKPRVQTAEQDQEVVIQCRDEGNTRLEVFWSRPDYRPLPENVIDQNGRLTISNIKCEDGGDYVCRPVKKKYKNYASISTVEVTCRTSPTTMDTALELYTPSPLKQIQTMPCQNFTLNGTCCHFVCEQCAREESTCKANQFRCSNGDCIENEKFCDGEIDCSDGSDEKDCSSSWLPKIIMLPKMNLDLTCSDPRMPLSRSSTLELQCAFVGYPVPTIKWKKYEGHVPSKCMQFSLNGHGTLKCPDFQQSDQGAYSCVAENSKGSSESQPKSIVKCSNAFYCDGFRVVDEHNIETCLECFCHGKTGECEGIKSEMVKNEMQFPEETKRVYIGANGEVSFFPFEVSSSWITYCSMPKDILASYSFLKSYGRNLNVPRYNDKSDFFIDAPDVIIGNDNLLLKYSFNQISHGSPTSDIRFWAGVWHHNNGTVASRRDIMKVLSNVDLLMFRCEYKTGIKLNLSDAIVTLESSKIADSSSVSYLEKCSCPKAYDGLSCEKCSPGYRRKSDGVDFVCEEDSSPFQMSCDEGYTGENCDQCDVMKAYYMNSRGQCTKSLCNMRGSLGLFPDEDDKCICKDNVAGDYCDTCKPGFFFLDEANPYGCKKCWCNNVSDKCTSSNWYKTEISSTSLGGYNASTGRNFWLLPSEFSGNRLTSYGGFLIYSMKYMPNVEKQPKALSVEILSNDDTTLKYLDMNLDHSKSGTEKTWNVPIEEPNWRDTKDKIVGREQLLKVLSNVKAIYIESPYHLNSGEVNLTMVQLDVAEEISNDFVLILSAAQSEKVEHCSCPEGYKGLSCESCSDGYYKKKIRNSFECIKCDCAYCDPEYGCRDCKKGEYNDNSNFLEPPTCLKCPCNGNEEYCYKDVYGQVMCICKINYSGISCEFRETTSSSHLNVKISPIKVKNKRAGTVVTFNCSYDSTEDMQIMFKKTYKVSTDKVKTPDSGLEIVHSTINMFDTISSANITIDLNLEFVECLVYNMNRVKVGHVFAIIEGTVTDFVKPIIENCYDEPKHVKETEDLDLICEARGMPEPEIQWYLKLDNSMEKVDTINGVHSITSADLNQNGTIYFCIATNSVGDDKCTTHIIVQKRCDIISAKPEHASVYEGENVRFVCSTTNKSAVTWSKVGYFMPFNGQVNEGTLDIANVQVSDAGEYLCEANTRDGYLSKTVTLSVNTKSEPPTAMIMDEDLVLTSGQDYEIECMSTGNPKPVIHWSKILDGLTMNTYVLNNKLIISSATAENAGVYECTATSILGNATSRISVKVIEQPRIRIEPHSINKVVKGKSLSLRCVVEKGIPAPTISWWKIDNPFLKNDETLWFQVAETEDAGRYICQADNEAGSATAEAEVVVVTPPTVELKPRGSLHAYIDDYVVVTCEAGGFPKPEITWKQKTVSQVIGRTKSEIKVLQKYDEKVNVKVTSDLHSIICKAENEVGEVSDSLLIIPKTRGWTSPGPKSESIRAELGEKVDLIFDGMSGVIECRKDNASLPGDVCYTSNGLEISSVQVHHRGTYRCQSKSDPLQEKSLVLAVTGFIHKFSEYLRSYLVLPMTVKSKDFRLEITFKADRPSGLILLSKRNHEFIICLTRNSTVKVKLHHFQKILALESRQSLKLHVWYTIVFKAGLTGELFIYDENGKIMETQSSALNFQINWNSNHSDEIFIGGASNKKRLTFPLLTARLPSFDGCISRLIIGDHEYRMTEEGKYSKDVSLCKVCSSSPNPCARKGVCLDAPTQYGFVCVCDENDWTCPKSCREQGCQMKNDLCKMVNPCINPENKCVQNQDRLSCRCAPGFSGFTCEKEEKFDFRLDGNGFVKLPPNYLPRYSFYRPETIAIKFTLSDLNGLLLWQGNEKNYLYLMVEDGMLEYTYYNQRKILTVKSNYGVSLSLNKTHYVEIARMNGTVTMNVDGDIFEGKSVFTTNRVHGDIYIGGISEDKKQDWPIRLKLMYGSFGFRGCIHSVAIGDVRKSINIMEKSIVRQNIRKCDMLHILQSYDNISDDLQSESDEDSAESNDDQIEYK